jgi:hypothetical protein
LLVLGAVAVEVSEAAVVLAVFSLLPWAFLLVQRTLLLLVRVEQGQVLLVLLVQAELIPHLLALEPQ